MSVLPLDLTVSKLNIFPNFGKEYDMLSNSYKTAIMSKRHKHANKYFELMKKEDKRLAESGEE